MKRVFFPKIAVTGIRKNSKLYLPYMLTCVGMVAMFYILQALSYSPALHQMRGGSDMELILSLGKIVIAIFSLIFLLYTNSFLIRRRNKEFGLYNVLGMGKGGICRVMIWETLTVAAIGLIGGLSVGIAFSKLAELALLRVIGAPVSYGFYLSAEAIGVTLIIYAVIFLVLFLRSLLSVVFIRPTQLLRSENVGEKPPKSNFVIAVLGVILLGIAYYMAIAIKTPLAAILLFFVAVILVIIATYLLFIAGSVVVCRLLQKNKRYYYKKNHFVSVSTMCYRMKRNGAGLASICILCTMVLVMISSTSGLYFGMDASLAHRYVRETELSIHVRNAEELDEAHQAQILAVYEQAFASKQLVPRNVMTFSYLESAGILEGETAILDAGSADGTDLFGEKLREFFFIPATEYNRLNGTDYHVEGDDVLLFTKDCRYTRDSIRFLGKEFPIVGTVRQDIPGEARSCAYPYMVFLIRDYSVIPENVVFENGYSPLSYCFHYGYDLNESKETVIENRNLLTDHILDIPFMSGEEGFTCYTSCRINEHKNFMMAYGGLFFIGLILSVVFLFAAAMIIYYKQISEGYEDRARFGIMRKVGMSAKDIRSNIDSQVLSVFFAPLLAAGIHLSFAFPLIWKILKVFGLYRIGDAILINILSFICFALIYFVIYKLTARSYYRIVSHDETE